MPAYLLDAATSAVSIFALLRMRAVPPPADAEPPSLARIKERVDYARARRELTETAPRG